MKKIKIYSELVYVIAQLGLTLAVAIMAAADFGVSMIVAPAYILSEKFKLVTFGEWSYIIQGFLFIAFCIAMRKIKLTYFVSFLTCVIYGYILDMWRALIPILNPNVTSPSDINFWVRIAMFIFGELLTAISVMLFFKSYIYPQVVDLFVKGIAQKYNINQTKFKKIFKTITCDNGTEFADWRNIEFSRKGNCIRTTVFYCHPYCSCERGSNENQNRILRRFIKKGVPISCYSDADIANACEYLNDLPRKIFNWSTARERFYEELSLLNISCF